MVTKKCAFEITIAESLDQARLDHLRGALNLKPDGRLADDWDYKFGHRYLQGEGARATSDTAIIDGPGTASTPTALMAAVAQLSPELDPKKQLDTATMHLTLPTMWPLALFEVVES